MAAKQIRVASSSWTESSQATLQVLYLVDAVTLDAPG
jgi:hypothetical protein